MDRAESFAAIALAAVACDGVLGRDEAHALRCELEYRTPYRGRSDAQMAELFDGLLAVLRHSDGLSRLVDQALPQLTAQQQETALAVAAQLVHADRVIAAEEQAFLDMLCARVQLPEGRAQAIVAAIEALNRDSLAS
ncbi:MAG: tellurite resistance TerB family protein [Synechococcus sp.]|nr:tellurite resistance TerB family protein [Synechococcus sp.]